MATHLSPLDTSFTINVQGDLELPPVHISTSPPNITGHQSPPFANTRARNEARKLLSHVLIQLANRSKPPSIVDAITNATSDSVERGFGAFTETLREAVKLGNNQGLKIRQNAEAHEDDSDDEGNIAFATDGTIDLLMQLKDVITMAIAQGWQIFDDSSLWKDGPHDADPKLPSFRSSRHSSKSGSIHPLSARYSSKGQVQMPELLSLCVSILGSIVAEDCRYRVAFPRPSRPPNALQILTLNIAHFLLHTHQHNPYIISQVTFAILPAFYTFHSHMYPRLLTFMETSVVRIVLQNLGRLHRKIVPKQHPEPSHETPSQPNSQQNLPLVSIQIDDVESNATQPIGGWTPSSPFTLSTTAVQSANDPHQSPQIYQLSFLIPPILRAVLDTLDTIHVSTISSEIHSRFGNLLDTLASSKLDLYNDLLEIIAYRGPNPRRLAVASLAKLWPKAVGHTVISRPLFSSDSVSTPESAYVHGFMPWYFNPKHRETRVNEILHDNCRSCSKIIDGQLRGAVFNGKRPPSATCCRVSLFLPPSGSAKDP
ncbi:hypothetical protein M413DRAFT_21375 [Hebeloma cylindrosporum]|uniref:Uncharacterized protein n=1 Tax=Hebeloma cylindrosporum TaxID=76867 RepID=A0A0C2YHB3_HEBCY|nr:hypothetical protein M413DRAFT_21375 [Hebeloma cylindrosporum h7]